MAGRVSTNFIYNSIYQITALLIPLITTPYLSRTIGAEGIGTYSLALSICTYFTLFVKLGLNNYGVRQIAYIRNDERALSRTFWEIYALQFSLGVLITGAYFAYCRLVSNNIFSYILGIYLISSVLDITWLFWGLEEFRLTATRDLIIKILTTILIFVFVKNKDDAWKYALLLCLGFLASQLTLWPVLLGRVHFVRPTLKGILQHVKPNFMLFIPTIAISLYKTMDKIMLGGLSNTVEVGFYQSSESIIQIPMALITSLGTVMQPRMSNMISGNADQEQVDRIFGASIILAMFLSSSLSFGIMTVASDFVPLFYGQHFEKCIALFHILLPSCLFLAFANVIRTQYLIPNKKDKEYIVSLFVGAFINLVINYLLIPRYQAAGAAIGTLCAEAAVCLMQIYLTRGELDNRRYFIRSLPFILSGVLMFVIWGRVTIPGPNAVSALLIKIVLAGLSYLVLLSALLFIWEKTVGNEVSLKMLYSMVGRGKGRRRMP